MTYQTHQSEDLSLKCPNCSSPIDGHPDNGCVLVAFMDCIADRENLTPEQVLAIHAKCDVDALWERLGPILDDLEEGHFSVDQP